MTRVQCGINYDVGKYFVGKLDTGFDEYSDEKKIRIDEGIKIGFSCINFKGFSDGKLEGLVIGVR